jgi:hypothetical protein
LWNRNRNFFALAEPESERIPVPNSLSVLEPDLDPTPNINEIQQEKIKNERPTFRETLLLLTLKSKIFYKFFVVEKTVLNIV